MKNYTAIIDAKIKDPTADFDIVMKNYQEIMMADLDALNLIIEASMTEAGKQSGTNFVTEITNAIASLSGIKIPAFDTSAAVASIDSIVAAAQAALAALQAIGAQQAAQAAANTAADAQAAADAAARAAAESELTYVTNTYTPPDRKQVDETGRHQTIVVTDAPSTSTIDSLIAATFSTPYTVQGWKDAVTTLAETTTGVFVNEVDKVQAAISSLTTTAPTLNVSTGLSVSGSYPDSTSNLPVINYSKAGVARFATGGAFTNGIVSQPTEFNMALMGEAGSEAIMPLTNVNGKLGVHVVQSANDSNMNSDEELAELKRQNQILIAQNQILQEGFRQLIVQNAQQNDHLDDISSTTRKQVNN